LLLVSGLGLVLMGFDKLSAKIDSERVPELWFVLISLAGGFSGVVLGMLVFHHKISKRSFQLKIAANGEIIASSEAYETKEACKNGIESVKTNAVSAEIVDKSM
jgi:uncharacterized protein YegP (UPF0339 family)